MFERKPCGIKLTFLTSVLIRGNDVVLQMDQRPYGLCSMYVKCQPHLVLTDTLQSWYWFKQTIWWAAVSLKPDLIIHMWINCLLCWNPLETSLMVLTMLFPHPGWNRCLFDRPRSHLFWSGAQLSETWKAGAEPRPSRGRYDGNAIINFKICLNLLLDVVFISLVAKFSWNLFVPCTWH